MVNIPPVPEHLKNVVTPPPPPLTLERPVGAAKAQTRLELRTEINIGRRKRNEPELPMPDPNDFQNVEEPLRIEIEALLDRVLGPMSEKKKVDYEKVVKDYMDVNYPGNPRLCRKVMDDLPSYRHWRKKDA